MNTKLLVWLLAFILGITVNSHAAFIVKKERTVAVQNETTTAAATGSAETTSATVSETTTLKKHSFLSRACSGAKAMLSGKAAIPMAAYIILCIFALGWLAIGLNDNFSGFSWILSLILYILFYLPGLLYSLIMMGNYY